MAAEKQARLKWKISVSDATALANGRYSFTVNTVDVTGGRTTSLVGVNLFETESIYTSAPSKTGAYANGYSLATVTDADGSITNAVLSGSSLPAGVGLNASTDQFTVTDRTLLRSGTYTVQTRTTDATGGITLQGVTINIGAYPLPVELTAFTAAVKNQDAQLAWRTASEKNNDHFDVERSFNGTDFAKIGQVKGQGTSSAATDYTLTDAGIGAKATGVVYYRLRQVDADGTENFSPVHSVTFPKVLAPVISLFPNPATAAGTKLDLTALPAGVYQVSVLDAAGRTVLRAALNTGLAHALDLRTVASGSYTLLVRGQNGGQVVNLTKRLIKE
ncbi:hypothetical protein AUC43_07270 [Hymenobacter sedentarius]|uniref:Secretion system C-terminal sorting domain-containing protein n=1 Tax=Hymenobacter sedentarius TaxID=1411621 RepID=A0A0U4BE97_9BACT|nr:hypothetical protein AUC43_07270 [Hymenobacter sedentarius]